jgi:hypothetical protein
MGVKATANGKQQQRPQNGNTRDIVNKSYINAKTTISIQPFMAYC